MFKRLSKLPQVYYFPLILLLVVVLLTVLRVSGTSVGYYHKYLYGEKVKDPDLLYGKPLPLRSDEWLVNTPMIIAQKNDGFPVVNKAVGQGQDMSIIIDVPTKDWSTIFRPQNWGFFFLSLEQAFALRWWLIAYLLIVAAYFFVLRFLPGKVWLAVLLSLGLFMSPFLQWWYQSISLLPLAYSLLALLLIINIVDKSRTRQGIVPSSLALVYVLFAFLLVLYPPWQITCGWVMAGVTIGYLLRVKPPRAALKKIAMGAAIVLFGLGLLGGGFYKTHKTAIQAVNQTVYPGKRVVPSGGYDGLALLSGYHNLQLQSATRAGQYGGNQSEVSNFILLMPLLALPTIYILISDYRQRRKTDWLLISFWGVALFFLANAFLPLPAAFDSLTLLSKVEHPRLLIGFGLLNFLILVFTISRLSATKPSLKLPKWLAYASGTAAFLIVFLVLRAASIQHPGYISNSLKMLLVSAWFGLLVTLMVKKRIMVAVAMIVIFSLVSSYRVNPLYKGLGMLTHSDLSTFLRASKNKAGPGHGWAVYDSYPLNTLPAAEGNSEISGVYTYPQLALWHQLDPKGHDTPVYNRYAHVFFRPTNGNNTIQYLQTDSFVLAFRPCEKFLQRNAGFVLSSQPLDSACLARLRTFHYPAVELFAYKINPR